MAHVAVRLSAIGSAQRHRTSSRIARRNVSSDKASRAISPRNLVDRHDSLKQGVSRHVATSTTTGEWSKGFVTPLPWVGFCLRMEPFSDYPPAIAPTIRNGSAPVVTLSGSGASGDSWERSSSQAKKRTNGRRWHVS